MSKKKERFLDFQSVLVEHLLCVIFELEQNLCIYPLPFATGGGAIRASMPLIGFEGRARRERGNGA